VVQPVCIDVFLIVGYFPQVSLVLFWFYLLGHFTRGIN
jgi:hypothetical protein